jgi:uncharacterized protein (TIGR02246 family)
MRAVLTAVFMIALAGPTFAQVPVGKPAVAQVKAASGDEAAIRSVIQQHDAARNKADWQGLSALFTDDAEQLTSAGEWRRGRADIEKGVAQGMATTYKGGTYTTKVEKVRLLSSTVALVDSSFEISNIAGGTRRGHSTLALVKAGGLWRIAASRSMVPTAAGSTPAR